MKALLLFLLFVAPTSAIANIGIPIFIYPAQWAIFFLVPVVIIEAYVLKKHLELSVGKSFAWAAIANIVSTLFGLMVAVALSFMMPFFMAPPGTYTDISTLILLYLFYRLSISIEYSVIGKKIKSGELRNAVVVGNRITYFMISVFLIANIVKNYYVHGYVIE